LPCRILRFPSRIAKASLKLDRVLITIWEGASFSFANSEGLIEASARPASSIAIPGFPSRIAKASLKLLHVEEQLVLADVFLRE